MAENLRVLLIGGPMYDPLYSRFKEFEENEGVRIEVAASLAHPELNDRIEGDLSSGEIQYDLISTHTKYAPSQARWLMSLDEVLDPSELETFDARTLELARMDGELLGVPRNLDVKLLYYRTDLLDAPPSSWEELLEQAAQLRSEDLYGFIFPGKESGLFGHFFEFHAMAGGTMFADSGPPVPHLNDEAGLWALTLLKNLQRKAASKETLDWHYDEVAACFKEGKAAMSTDWPGGFYTYEDPQENAVARCYDVALYPQGRAGRFIYSGSHTFAIPNTVRDPQAALALLRFLTSRESQAYEARLGTLPARTDALEDARAAAPEGSLSQRRWRLLEEAAKVALIPPKHQNYPAVEDAIWEGLRSALLDDKDVPQALQDTEDSARQAAHNRAA